MATIIYLQGITHVGNMASYPAWVSKHKGRGIAVERRGDRYYASRVRSVWDPEKGRAKKITVEYLGRVTREGILPPKHKRPPRVGGILEAGNISLLQRFAKHLAKPLAEYWPYSWQSILAAGVLKLAYGEPLKSLQFRYETSLASRLWPEAAMSKNSLTGLLEHLGREWGSQRSFFEFLSKADSHMAIDLTQVFSDSRNINWLEKGYNAKGLWHDQLQLLLIWGVDTHRPGFLKLLPGAVASAQSLVNAIIESRLRNVVLVGDKAFFSTPNVSFLEDAGVHYCLALARDLPFVEYVPASRYRSYFMYRKRPQWFRSYEWRGRTVHVYLDKVLAGEEEAAFLEKVEAGKATMDEYDEVKHRFGTLALLTDTGMDAKAAYELYRQRREIEDAFDALKNTLEGDKTWMQSRESLQGYFFILFIALHIYSQVLDHLRRKDLLGEYSVHDVLAHLSKVYVVNVNGKDFVGEVTKQTQKVIDKVEVPITENLGS